MWFIPRFQKFLYTCALLSSELKVTFLQVSRVCCLQFLLFPMLCPAPGSFGFPRLQFPPGLHLPGTQLENFLQDSNWMCVGGLWAHLSCFPSLQITVFCFSKSIHFSYLLSDNLDVLASFFIILYTLFFSCFKQENKSSLFIPFCVVAEIST
jgi:hypothetical protein